MISGAEPEEVIEWMGDRQTYGVDIKEALYVRGIRTTKTRLWGKKKLDNLTFRHEKIVCVVMKRGTNDDGRQWRHWVIIHNSKVYDPCFNNAVPLEKYFRKYMTNARFTSWFEVLDYEYS